MIGGFQSPNQVGSNEQKILDQIKDQVQIKLGRTFNTFKGITYQTQVVAGTNYLFTVESDDKLKIRIKVFVPLPYSNGLPQVIEAVVE